MKKILALLLALSMIFALVACGQAPAPAKEEAPAEAPAAEEPAAEAEAPAEEPAATSRTSSGQSDGCHMPPPGQGGGQFVEKPGFFNEKVRRGNSRTAHTNFLTGMVSFFSENTGILSRKMPL